MALYGKSLSIAKVAKMRFRLNQSCGIANRLNESQTIPKKRKGTNCLRECENRWKLKFFNS